jgi:hypothetical protein
MNKEYPVSFCAKLLVQEQDSAHEISIVARKYSATEGISLCVEGKETVNLTERDAYALLALLKMYIEGKYEHTEAY